MSAIKSAIHWTKSLKGQMAISYVLVTFISILIFETLIFGGVLFFLTGENSLSERLQRTAVSYANQIPSYFNEDGTFQTGFFANSPIADTNPGQITFDAGGIVVSYIDESSTFDSQEITLGLVLSPDYRILASSYPKQYPVGVAITQILPTSTAVMEGAEAGGVEVAQFDMAGVTFLQTAVPVLASDDATQLGFVYLHTPNLPAGANLLVGTIIPLLIVATVMAVLILPFGLVFGLFSTRGHINRLEELTEATRRFAQSDFSQRIPVRGEDELGELEQQFNVMAERIVESIARETELIANQGAAEERERISMELHDSLSQDIFSLNMLAGGLQEALPDNHRIQAQIRLLQNTIDHMIREMRALIIAMRPALLEDHSFNDAIHSYINHYHRLDIEITADIEDGLHLDPKEENALFRIAQEAISNAVRHADANQIVVVLYHVGQDVVMTITDDGNGFSVEKAHPGFGLDTMNGRVKALKGLVNIESSHGKGTVVKVTIPRGNSES